MSAPPGIVRLLGPDPERLGPRTWASADRVASVSRSPRTHAQLLTFHARVAPALSAGGLPVPRLLDHDDTHTVVERAPGSPLARALEPFPHPPAAALEVLGRWLAVLHQAAPVPEDPLPLDRAVARRIDASQDALPRAWVRAIRPELDPSILESERRSWTHRDLHPRNVLWDGQQVVLIDWEHSRPDHRAVDFARVHPALVPALARGYGPLPRPDVLRLFQVLDAASTLAWGLRHQDAGFVDDGVRRLQALGLSPQG